MRTATTKSDWDRDVDALCAAFASLRDADEARRFLSDLATPAEVKAFAERWRIAQLLDEGRLSYREIAAAVGGSTATVARVARFLRDEPHQGYRLMLGRRPLPKVKKSKVGKPNIEERGATGSGPKSDARRRVKGGAAR